MATYPGAIPAKPTIVSADMSAATSHATDRGLLWDELRAFMAEAGTTPSAGFSTIAARFTDIESNVTAVTSTAAGKVDKSGDTMTGTGLLVNASSGATPLILRTSTNDPKVDLQSTVGVRYAYVAGDSTGLDLLSVNDIVFHTDNTLRARMESAVFLMGKTTTNLATAGIEMHLSGSGSLGSIRSTTTAASIQNAYLRHVGSADANAQLFVDLLAGGVSRGSITQVSTTGVAFNTTSDERMKTVLRDLDDDEIATILRMIAPVVFEFNTDRGNEHIGFIAQHLAATWPTFIDVGIVTPGYGEPGDKVKHHTVTETVEVPLPLLNDAGDFLYGPDGEILTKLETVKYSHKEETPGTGFRPWMVDLGKLTPLLVAGWQQLDRRISALEPAPKPAPAKKKPAARKK